MSTKMKVRYGVDAKSITDVSSDERVITFIVTDEEDNVIGRQGFDMGEMPTENQNRTFLYGGNKLLTDRTSEQKDKLKKLNEMQAVYDLLVSGEWAKERAVGAVEVSVFVEALAQMSKQSIPDTQAALGQYDKDVRKAILEREDVQMLGKEIAHARATRKLASLDDFVPA